MCCCTRMHTSRTEVVGAMFVLLEHRKDSLDNLLAMLIQPIVISGSCCDTMGYFCCYVHFKGRHIHPKEPIHPNDPALAREWILLGLI